VLRALQVALERSWRELAQKVAAAVSVPVLAVLS
jgi:hypothetical protein